MKLNRFAIDLHIHSTLSPCGDSTMTPQNIVRMARLEGLSLIAVTDHNSMANVGAVIKAAARDLTVIPAMEVQSREEVHLLALFPTLDDAETWQAMLWPTLPHQVNDEQLFGSQVIYDWKDRVLDKVERLLSVSSLLSVEQVVNGVHLCGGIVIPAHVDRRSFGIIAQLGFIPPELDIEAVEVSADCDKGLWDRLSFYHPVLFGSDAHDLKGMIAPLRTYLYASQPTFSELLLALRQERGRRVVVERAI